MSAPRINVNELDEAQALRNLSHRKLILVGVPEAAAADIIAMVAYAVSGEEAVPILNRGLKTLQVQRRILSVYAGLALLALDHESHLSHHQNAVEIERVVDPIHYKVNFI